MIGKALKYMRKNNNFKQEIIAKKLNIKCNTLSQYETENRQASFEIIEKIANMCGYKIYFENDNLNDRFTINDLKRKDV